MLFMLVAHNLRTLMRVRAAEKGDFYLSCGFIRQARLAPKPYIQRQSKLYLVK